MLSDGRLGATSFSFWQQSTQPDCVSFYLCKHQKGKLPVEQPLKCPILDPQHGRMPDTLTKVNVNWSFSPLATFSGTSSGSHVIRGSFCAGRMQRVERMVKESKRPSER